MTAKNELKEGVIQELQRYISEKIDSRGFNDEPLHERLLLLMEEVGELAKACRKLNGMNIDVNRSADYDIGEEITDVLNMLFAVGIVLNIDIEKEFLKKESIVDKRFYERSKTNKDA